MASYNTKKESIFTPDTTNMDGNQAFKYPPKLELILRCTCNFNEDTYYASNEQILKHINNLAYEIGKTEPEFVLKLSAWLRNEMNMRSISVYLLALMAGHPDYKETFINTKDGKNIKQGVPKPWLMQYAPYIMLRADEMAECLSAFNSIYPGDKFPQALLKSINLRLNNLSDYEAIKYRDKKNNWSLKDVIAISHPNPKDQAQSYIFNWIVNEKANKEEAEKLGLNALASYLEIINANNINEIENFNGGLWEILVSKFGSKEEVWRKVEKIMPSFAYLRNIRNIISKANMSPDYNKIVNSARGKRILPFRFMSAQKALDGFGYEMSQDVQNAKDALEEAMNLSLDNIPNLGNIAILVDYSGSMGDRLSAKSDLTRNDAAKCFAASAFKRADNSIIIEYENNANIVKNIHKKDRMFSIMDKLNNPCGGTNLEAALLLAEKYLDSFDTLYILTDEQSNSQHYKNAYEKIKSMMGKKPSLKVINHNLSSYGTSELPQSQKIIDIGGWNDQIFNIVKSWQKGGLVENVENWAPACIENEE